MRTLLSFLFIVFITGNIFSQNNSEITVSSEKFRKATQVKDIITCVPESCDVIVVTYSLKVSGKQTELKQNGSKIPESIKDFAYKGNIIYLDIKSKEKNTGKITANNVKIIIE